jgi:hypothetical protein
LLQIKFENYNTVTDNHPEMSKELAMANYLDYDDDMIKKNREWLENEQLWQASVEYKVEKAKSDGNPYISSKK